MQQRLKTFQATADQIHLWLVVQSQAAVRLAEGMLETCLEQEIVADLPVHGLGQAPAFAATLKAMTPVRCPGFHHE